MLGVNQLDKPYRDEMFKVGIYAGVVSLLEHDQFCRSAHDLVTSKTAHEEHGAALAGQLQFAHLLLEHAFLETVSLSNRTKSTILK